MTEASPPTSCSRLDFCSPLSNARADRLVESLASRRPTTVLDVGCGWGELLLRVVAAAPGATGIGFDLHAPDVERARAAASTRNLADRVDFHLAPGGEHAEPADLVLCIGASQVFGEIPVALRRLRELVNPGGRLLFGDGFWERPPAAAELGRLWQGATADDHTDLPGLVGQAQDAGFTALWVESSNRDEWEYFESGFIADEAEWLLDHPDAGAAQTRQKVASMRSRALGGTRDLLGFAYLTLGVPA